MPRPSPHDILRRVRAVEIRSRRLVDDALVGAYHSSFKGSGMEFAEVREYLPGDDVRNIDWNVTAKQDRPFIKVYEEERELTLLLAVDLSASLDFGSGHQTKRELAAELAATLALSAARNNDKVGLVLFTDRIEVFLPPRKGRQHMLRVVREILFYEPKGQKTDLVGALRQLNNLHRRKAICFLFSDFLTPETTSWTRPNASGSNEQGLRRALSTTARRHDLVAVELHDPREGQLPNVGIITLEDAETGEQVEVNTNRRDVQALYAQVNHRRRDTLARMIRKAGADHLPLTTDQAFITALRAFFAQRTHRR
ncbi:MAG: DUF58 domain-containing protein [Verrucomicrobiota bacterium JB022]|nr:DUF58 domain-containing protein [Verrucomicrobiota bacterium JB022]